MEKCRMVTKANVKTFIESIDTILCDCDGVLYHMNEVIQGVPEVVHKLKSMGKQFLYVTNNSTKTRKEFSTKCESLGYPATEDDVIGSGFVTAQCLKNKFKYSGLAYCVGAAGLAEELKGVGITAVGVGPESSTNGIFKEAENFSPDPRVKCVVVGIDEHFGYLKCAKAVTYLANKDCLFIATNPDSGIPSANGRILPGAGSCVAMVETASQRKPDIVCGKPNKTMFDEIVNKYHIVAGKTLMIGDRLDTDILFAGRCGLHSLLVLTGFSTLDEVKIKQKSKSVDDQKQIPEYYLASLADLLPLLNDM